MKRKRDLKGEEGFTLIEIIAVLIVLGVLAAVAVPRYMDVVEDSKNQSAVAAVAEGKARVNGYAASYILSNNGTCPLAANVATSALGSDAGDFTLSYGTSGTTGITVTATGKTGTPADGGTASGTVKLPDTAG